MVSRRGFLAATLPAACPGMVRFDPLAVDAAALAARGGTAEQCARDEDFWSEVARAFTVDRNVVNLNNGGVSPAPARTQETVKRYLDYAHTAPTSIALWETLEPKKEGVRRRLARHWGVDAEEIALTRNASESLEICQLGFDLRPGDEVLTTDQDYPRMLTAFRQRARREGIVLRQISLPAPCEDDDEVVRRFEAALSERTRLVLVCHVVFLNGQVLPVRRVAAAARRRGVPTIIDGAHALAHVPFSLAELDCDYYGSSLHKWLFAPHGTGLLYVRRQRIAGLWPLMPADERLDGDIRKFEEIGTHPAAPLLGIAASLTFHQALGDDRKAARLHELKRRWAERLLGAGDRFRLHTSLDPRFSCGIATVGIEGIDPGELAGWLRRKRRIIVTPIRHEQFQGVRVSPSVYTTPEEIDRFGDAMEHAARRGIE